MSSEVTRAVSHLREGCLLGRGGVEDFANDFAGAEPSPGASAPGYDSFPWLGHWRDFAFNPGCLPVASDFEVITGLEIEPKLRRRAKIMGKAKSHFRGNGSLLCDDFIHGRGRHPQGERELVRVEPEGIHEFLA